MKVSIIIPVYNGGRYLAECIESCMNQDTEEQYEIIVVNDGSNDDTILIATSYRGVKVFSKNNGGTASALNLGIEKAQGEWIKWVSADDSLLPDALSTLLKNVDEKNLIYYTGYNIINEKSELVSVFHDKQYERPAAAMVHSFFGNGTTSLVHKSVFHTVGMFDEGLPYNEDYEFWLRCLAQYNIPMKYTSAITANYRVHSKSLTSTKNKKENLVLLEYLQSKYRKFLVKDDTKYLNSLRLPMRKRIGRLIRGKMG